jgi:RNA polymerase sigma-70 factor (ECF subfamily)
MGHAPDDREAVLIERATAGDDVALERLMMLHHDRLAADLQRKIPDNVRGYIAVDDILQEAYVRIFRQMDSFESRGPGSFFAWMAKIAEHRLFDAVKAERAAKRGGGRARIDAAPGSADSVIAWLEILAVYSRTPSRSAAGRESIFAIQDAISKMKKDYQAVLRYRYIQGLSVAETATQMNRTEGAVCLLAHRAMKRLGVLLGQDIGLDDPPS